MEKYFKEDTKLLTMMNVKDDFENHCEELKKRSVVIKNVTSNDHFLVIVKSKTELIGLDLFVWGDEKAPTIVNCIDHYEHKKIHYYWFECFEDARFVEFRANYLNQKNNVIFEVHSLKKTEIEDECVEETMKPFFFRNYEQDRDLVFGKYGFPHRIVNDDGDILFHKEIYLTGYLYVCNRKFEHLRI